MKTMNYESSKWSRDAIDDVPVDEEELARKRKRRRIIVAIVLILLVVAAAWFMMRPGAPAGGEKAGPKAAAGQRGAMPAVSFIVPTAQDVPIMISATGTLAAVRDMPVGIAGEGGRVVRVLVEPGQSVRAGQVLAVIDRSVQAQQAAQLAASIEVARADLQLAQNNLQRAESLVGRGFISRADLDQKRATRDAAAARVRVASRPARRDPRADRPSRCPRADRRPCPDPQHRGRPGRGRWLGRLVPHCRGRRDGIAGEPAAIRPRPPASAGRRRR